MRAPGEQIVVGLGELLWDCFADSRRPGGAPANVAFWAQQLGHRGLICSRVGDDDAGRELLADLESRGLDTHHIQRDGRRPTGKVTVETTDPQRPSYVIHQDVAWDCLECVGDVQRLMRGAAAVCFGTLAQRSSRSRETIRRALVEAADALIVYDVNLRPPWYRRDWIERSMQAARIVKLNTDEVESLAAVLQTGSAEPAAFAAALRNRFGAEIVCVTRAERGCVVIGPEETVDLEGLTVEVADAVGSGDAFTAALISGCLRQWPLAATARFANAVGAWVAGRPGAMPQVGGELAALLAEAEGNAAD